MIGAACRSCATTSARNGRGRPGRATVRFETAPGPQRQSDWGEIETVIGGQATVVHVRVNTLGDSRRFHFWGTDV